MRKAQLKSITLFIGILITLSISIYALSVTLNAPVSKWSLSNSVSFNFTAKGERAIYDWCAIWSNYTGTWSMKANYSNILNNTPFISGIAIPQSVGQTYIWNAQCWNGSGSADVFNNTNATFGVDFSVPAITLDYPVDEFFVNNNNISLLYTPTDAYNLQVCQVYHNINGTWRSNTTNSSVNTGGQHNVTYQRQADGNYSWNIYCNDTAENNAWAETSSNRTFIIDTKIPTPIRFLTVNDTVTANSTPLILWNATNETNFQKYMVSVSDLVGFNNVIQTIEIFNGVQNSTILNQLTLNKQFYIMVGAYDKAGWIMNATQVLYLATDTLSPNVTLNSPLNNTYTNDTQPDFNVTLIDNNPDSCRVFLSNSSGVNIVLNTTLNIFPNGTQKNITIRPLNEGYYKYNIECNDSVGTRVNASATDLTLTIDTTNPEQVNFTSSWLGTNNTDKTPTMEWKTSKETNFDRYMIRAYYQDNNTIANEINVTTRTQNYTNLNLTAGFNYNFTLTVFDKAGNNVIDKNTSTQKRYYIDTICGVLNTGWNLCGAVWTATKNLSIIGAETSAQFVTVWNNTNHVWATCNYGTSTTNCGLNVSINAVDNHAVWIYVNETKDWRNRTWVATSVSANINLNNKSIGWNLEAGFLRAGITFRKLGLNFTGNNVSLFSMPFNNGTSASYVNSYPFSVSPLFNTTVLPYGRGIWIYYNTTGNTTWDVDNWG